MLASELGLEAAAPSEHHDIHLIDTLLERPGFDAAYLVVGNGRGAFVDCGTSLALPQLLAGLEQAGLTLDQVDWLVLTHVHLDHAGGAGQLIQQLPNARVVVHPRGARHLIDPQALIAGATAVYGEAQMQRVYGQIVPVPAERVVEAPDGHIVDLAGRPLLCLDAPGHARHHLVVHEPQAAVFIAGDCFGLSYRELDSERGALVIPSTTPVQFDPEALHASIERICEHRPEAILVTHFGRIEDVPARAADLHQRIDAMVEIARRHAGHNERHAAICTELAALYLGWARDHGVRLDDATVLDLLRIDIDLNAQGLEVWLDRA